MGSIYSCVMKNCRYVTNTVGINNLNEEMGKRGSNNAIDVKRQLQNGVEPLLHSSNKKNKSQMTVEGRL